MTKTWMFLGHSPVSLLISLLCCVCQLQTANVHGYSSTRICCTYTLCSLICQSLLPSSSVLGRSIVVYGTGAQSGQLLGCSNIEPSLVAEDEIEISFPWNGTDPGYVDRCLLNYIHDTTILHHAPLAECETYEYIYICIKYANFII